MRSTVSGHRTAVLEVDGGSVWYLVTRGSEGVTQYLLIDFLSGIQHKLNTTAKSRISETV
jgi:hypothetical protein